MVSEKYELTRESSDQVMIPNEAELMARYNGLDKKSTRTLRLLAEEMSCMLPKLLTFGDGSFWIENEGRNYELHLSVKVNTYERRMLERRRKLSSVQNAASSGTVGIKEKIVAAAEWLMYGKDRPLREKGSAMPGIKSGANSAVWSLLGYRDSIRDKQGFKQESDELEKSIIANLADDVTVGITKTTLEIAVKKNFG